MYTRPSESLVDNLFRAFLYFVKLFVNVLGKRSCLGELIARQEIFMFLTGLVQQFNILRPEGCQKIECDECDFDGVMSPRPFKVRLIGRIRS